MTIQAKPLGFPWQTTDPFLFCVHHRDDYPKGDGALGIDASHLEGRDLGMDFSGAGGFSMYHGRSIPGFPRHPHRGFETVTLARRGSIDHSDSLGATARFSNGDVQWMTAGRGIVHSEMFPMLHENRDNPTELFQIWLNLPAVDKMVEPHFSMLWAETIPQRTFNAEAKITLIAGEFDDLRAPAPPPHSWASKPDAGVVIWTLELEPEATFVLPAAAAGVDRSVYFFEGAEISVDGQTIASGTSFRATSKLSITNGARPSEMLILGGRPIAEPVASHGPFVMNTQAEIAAAFEDFHATGFGGWPWADDAPVHAADQGRFAIHADGRREDAPG